MHSERFKDEVIPLQNSLFRFAKALLRDPYEAEDVVQEVFAKLWSRKDSLENVINIKAFVFKMTRNLSLDKIKLRKQAIDEVEKNRLPLSAFNPHELTEIKDM